jgi:ribosome-associated protein
MVKTTSQRKPRTITRRRQTSRLRHDSGAQAGEAGTRAAAKPASSKLPKAIQVAIDAARDKKATGVVVLDLRKAGAFTDFFVICSAANPRQVQAIADAVESALKAQKQRPSLVEGYARAEWVLLDYFDFVIHVFSKHARDFYGLDRLWGSATRIEFPDVA